MLFRDKNMITRHRLMQAFDELGSANFLYVSAPAGYGKTVAVRQWLDKNKSANMFVSLDEYDNELPRFCEKFCRALHFCQPQNSSLAEIVLHAGFGAAPGEFARKAIAALSNRKRTILVIDDLHIINDKNVLHILLLLLKQLPDKFQIILISRLDLPKEFSTLWLKGQLERITAEQLLFTKEAIMSLYKKRKSEITSQQAEDIVRFTQGWAIGINALLLSGGVPRGEVFEHLDNFIQSNVWEHWDEASRNFMLATAQARELHPSLCNLLAEVGDSEKILDQFLKEGAFIWRSNDGVYHYHHLFQDFLRRKLDERGEEFAKLLLEKEGEWYLEQQDFFSAVDCFIRCRNHAGIAKCWDFLEVDSRNNFLIDGIVSIVKLEEIRAAADTYPHLFLMMAWAAYLEGRAEDAVLFWDNYYARYPEIVARNPELAHNIFYMRFIDFRIELRQLLGDAAALTIAPDIKGMQGSTTLNLPLIHRSMCDFSELSINDTEANVAMMSATVGWLLGEECALLAESLCAGLLLDQGRLEKAHTHALLANAEIKKQFTPESKFCALAVLVFILDALGDSREAEHIIKRISSMIEQDRAYYLNRNFNALITRRKLNSGNTKAAEVWLLEFPAEPDHLFKWSGEGSPPVQDLTSNISANLPLNLS
jgi:LuxR family maltose regulon positive regulatory protein